MNANENPAFELQPTAPRTQVDLNIVVNGEKLGVVHTTASTSTANRYHAVLTVADRTAVGVAVGVGLAQGHGESPEEAINNAIENGHLAVATYQAGLNTLITKLAGAV